MAQALSGAERQTLAERDARYPSKPPSEAATKLAAAIGHDRRIEGYDAIIAAKDVDLLRTAVQSSRGQIGRDLPQALEAILIEHYSDSLLGPALRGLVGGGVEDHVRVPRYHTRQLFDLFYADLKTRRDAYSIADRIVATDLPDIEPGLLAILPGLDAASANELVNFFGERRYAGAVPALVALYATPYEKETNQLIRHITLALRQIGTPAADDAVIARLQQLKTATDPRAAQEIGDILSILASEAPDAGTSWASIRRALPDTLNSQSQAALANLVLARKEKTAIKDLVRCCLAQAPNEVVQTVLAVGDPDDWRTALDELRMMSAASTKPDQSQFQIQRLERAIGDPAKEKAAGKAREREAAYATIQNQQNKSRERIAKMRESDPQRYVTELEAWLVSMETQNAQYMDVPAARNLVQRLPTQYRALSSYIRKRLKQPDRAIALASKPSPASWQPMEAFSTELLIADIYRFDKQDTAQAIAHYRAAIQAALSVAKGNDDTQRLIPPLQNWIEAEIAFLKAGKTVTGKIGRKDLMPMGAALMVVDETQEVEPSISDAVKQGDTAALERALIALAPSLFNLRYINYTPALPPKAAVRFLIRNDPAGYVTTAYLGLTGMRVDPGSDSRDGADSEPRSAVEKEKEIAAAYFKSRGITLALAADPRFASPEKTWSLYRASSNRGDRMAMLECFTDSSRSRFDHILSALPAEVLQKMGEQLSDLTTGTSFGQFQERYVTRMVDGKRYAFAVTFMNLDGEWKIESM